MIGGVFFDDFAMYELAGSERLGSPSSPSCKHWAGCILMTLRSLCLLRKSLTCWACLSVRQLGTTGHSLINKPSRLQKLSQLLAAMSAKGRITKHEAQVVCGILNFAMNFCMGHALKVAMRAFVPTDVMPSELAKLCSWTSEVLLDLSLDHPSCC